MDLGLWVEDLPVAPQRVRFSDFLAFQVVAFVGLQEVPARTSVACKARHIATDALEVFNLVAFQNPPEFPLFLQLGLDQGKYAIL